MSYYDDLSVGSSDDHGSIEGSSENEDDASVDGDHQWLLASGGRHRSTTTTTTTPHSKSPPFSSLATGLWSRCILHLDVDCFYCQCEEIDRNLRTKNTSNSNSNSNNHHEPIRPLAIGQKHIIVTANYAARKYGVQKLQSREAAYAACPHLWIVEGSDLTSYRKHSRAIYEAFRNALKEIAISEESSSSSSLGNRNDLGGDHKHSSWRIPAKKGCMDEMMADLTLVVEQTIRLQDQRKGDKQSSSSSSTTTTRSSPQKQSQYDTEQARFIFGEDAPSSMAILVEDQTGEKSIVSFQPSSMGGGLDSQEASLASSRRNIHNNCGASDQDRHECQRRLEIAADLTERICHYIRQYTGFHTTGGVSVSPLLAKLASGLHKPKSVNLLLPWRSSQLLYSMPLRKMHNIGHGTMKVLEKEMAASDDLVPSISSKSHGSSNGDKDDRRLRTVRDLLEMPRSAIRQAIRGMAAFQGDGSSEDQCDRLIQQCRGLDTTDVVDDEGRLPKTISVENSFRRGTLQNIEAVNQALEDLYRRLPLLLRDRASWATDPQKAFPTTIRLSIRIVDPQLALVKKRRPYVTKSKQTSIDGKRCFVQESDLQVQAKTIRRHIKSLLQQLLPSVIDVTRMNIALTNFQDVSLAETIASEPKRTTGQSTLTESLGRKRSSPQSQSQYPQCRDDTIALAPEQKRPKVVLTNDPVAMGHRRVSPDTFASTPSKFSMSARGHSSSHTGKGRMKSTRIDHFFFKKE